MRGIGGGAERLAVGLAVMLVGALARASEPGGPDVGATTATSEIKPEDVSVGAWAQRLFEEGSQAFTVGDYGLAIRKFEAAYAATQAVELLYNIALAHVKRHANVPDVADLRRARLLFDNFAAIREANGEDVRDARARVVQIDEQLAAIEAERVAAERREAERVAAERSEAERVAAEQRAARRVVVPEGPTVYRPRRLGIAGYASLGGGLLLGGGLATAGFVSLARLQTEYVDEAGMLPVTGERGAEYADHEREARTLGLVGVGVGAALVVAGVAMVVVDARRGRVRRVAVAGPSLQVRF